MVSARGLFFILTIVISPSLLAGNTTLTNAFDGTEPNMAASAVGCSDVVKPFKQFDTFQVSSSGNYEVFDAGNNAFVLGQAASVADIVVSIYSGIFSSADPSANRLAEIDETGVVALQTGVSYTLVAQYWCERDEYGPAPFAVVIIGDGNITGGGFNSPFYTLGTFAGTPPTAFFSELNGFHAYSASSAINFPQTGNFVFADFLGIDGSEISLWVYENSFDANNPEQNRVATLEFYEDVFLEAGKSYIFVAIDRFDFLDRWQFVLFPPGDIVFNPGLNGAWVIDGIGGQGILAEVLQNSNLMFFAWFTYNDAPLVVTQSGTQTQNDGGATKPETHLGSFDQRWLTGFGALPGSGSIMSISFENSTGGAFDSTFANPSTDSGYGVGSIQLIDCNSFNLSYNLPGGLADTVLFERILPDGAMRCYKLLPQAPIQPPIQ